MLIGNQKTHAERTMAFERIIHQNRSDEHTVRNDDHASVAALDLRRCESGSFYNPFMTGDLDMMSGLEGREGIDRYASP